MKLCPFCKRDARLAEYRAYFKVQCRWCFAASGPKPTAEDAIKAWDRRSQASHIERPRKPKPKLKPKKVVSERPKFAITKDTERVLSQAGAYGVFGVVAAQLST